MKTIPMLIESSNGHDTVNVPENKIEEAVKQQLNENKWVTLEKKDGSTEILTKSDLPKNEDWKGTFANGAKLKPETKPVVPQNAACAKPDFSRKFEQVRSATSTIGAKGG